MSGAPADSIHSYTSAPDSVWCDAMKPPLLLLLAVPLSVHAQAVRPAPMPVPRPPAHTPGYFPGTPPEPVYAPNGAGLPGERVPETVAPPVQRSKGRILPHEPDGAPGLWAADGASRASSASTVSLFEVDLPLPPDSGAAKIGRDCALEMTLAMRDAQQFHVQNYLYDVRACIAAKALLYCSSARREDRERTPWRNATSQRTLEAHATTLAGQLCKAKLTDEQRKTLERVEKQWEQNTMSM